MIRELARLMPSVLLVAPALAGSVTHTVTTPLTAMPFTNVTASLPQFDPALGALLAAEFRVEVEIQGTAKFENTSNQATACFVNVYASPAISSITQIGGQLFGSGAKNGVQSPQLPPFDGALDYAGSSGAAVGYGPMLGNVLEITFWSPTHLDALTGTSNINCTSSASPATPGWACFPQAALDVATMQGTVTFKIKYDFTPYPATTCVLNPPEVSCPCNNNGSPACGNSENANGANLAASGTASISGDTLVLVASGMPATASLVFAQGSTSTLVGAPYGDGRLCIGGSILRLGIKFASGGGAQYPGLLDAPISAAGMIAAPGTLRAYQAVYRDAAAFCTASTFNTSRGVRVLWTP